MAIGGILIAGERSASDLVFILMTVASIQCILFNHELMICLTVVVSWPILHKDENLYAPVHR